MMPPSVARYAATGLGKPGLKRELQGATRAACSGYENTRSTAKKLGCSGVAGLLPHLIHVREPTA